MIRQLGGGGVKIEGRRGEWERDGDKERNVEEGKKGRRGKGRKGRKGEGGRGGREEREKGEGEKERKGEGGRGEGKKGRRGKGRRKEREKGEGKKERKGERGRGGRKEKKKLIQDAIHQNTQCHENSLAVECSASSDCYPQICPAHDTRRLPWHRLGCVVSAREPASVLPAPAECGHRGSLVGGCQHKARGSGAPG